MAWHSHQSVLQRIHTDPSRPPCPFFCTSSLIQQPSDRRPPSRQPPAILGHLPWPWFPHPYLGPTGVSVSLQGAVVEISSCPLSFAHFHVVAFQYMCAVAYTQPYIVRSLITSLSLALSLFAALVFSGSFFIKDCEIQLLWTSGFILASLFFFSSLLLTKRRLSSRPGTEFVIWIF